MKQPPFQLHRVLIASLITTLTHGAAFADDAGQPAITVTASPITEDQQAPVAATVNTKMLETLTPATSDTASLLQSVPGLSIQGAGGVSGLPVIHGLADDRLRIKVDGMDLISACGNHMNPPLSYIDPTSVGSATVFAGITPVSVGGDSIGGTILVDSIDPVFASAGEGVLIGGEIGLFNRSNNNAMGGNLAATLAGENVNLTYRGSTTQADDYTAGDNFKAAGAAAAGRDWLDTDEVGSTMYKSTNQSLALALRAGGHLIELKAGVQDIPYQGYPNQRMDMTGNDSTQLIARYEGGFDWGMLKASAYNEKTRHKMQFYDDKLYWYATPDGVACTPAGGGAGCAAGMPMDTDGDNTGATVKLDLFLSDSDLFRIGGEMQQYQLDDWWDPSGRGMWPETFWNIRDGERDRLALFGEWESQWSQRWLTQFGVRGERVDMDSGTVQGYATATSPAPWNAMIAPKYIFEAAAFNSADRSKTDYNLDLTTLTRFTPTRSNTLEVGYARKTRSPNLYERYTWSTNGMSMRMINWTGDGNGYVGNLELDPEVAHTVSATLEWHDMARERWSFKVAPYYTFVQDYIDARRCGPSDVAAGTTSSACSAANLTATSAFVYLKYVNQSARLYGIDLSTHFPLATNTAIGSFSASGVLNVTRGENESTDDNLYGMMPLNVKLALEHRLGSWSNTFEVEAVDDKSDVSAVRNELQTDAYSLLHLRSSYAWKGLRFDIGVENLLDKGYDHPLGGAYLGQGKTMSGTDVAWGTPVPGMGRSIYSGISYKF